MKIKRILQMCGMEEILKDKLMDYVTPWICDSFLIAFGLKLNFFLSPKKCQRTKKKPE